MRKIYQNKGLIISRIPQKKKQLFLEMAKEHYCNDYGMCLSSLLDHVMVLQPLITRMDSLEMKLLKLEGEIKGMPEQKQVKTMSGKVLK